MGLEWPEQLLLGLVCSLDKRNQRQDAQGYRPICLFSILSIIYRTCSGIRARQLLRIVADLTDRGALGFLPQRETADLWYSLEAMVELAAQGLTLPGYPLTW